MEDGTLIKELRALIEQWRTPSMNYGESNEEYWAKRSALDNCADELEEILESMRKKQ